MIWEIIRGEFLIGESFLGRLVFVAVILGIVGSIMFTLADKREGIKEKFGKLFGVWVIKLVPLTIAVAFLIWWMVNI